MLVEHQSTVNPNMALRLLLYIAHVYEGTVKGKALYAGKRISIPRPEFFVLYNGTSPYPDEDTLHLSDLFEKTEELGPIKYCMEHDILKEFLEKHSTEVINMLLTEWNWDDAKEVWQEEAREEGMEKGMEKTARNAMAEGLPLEVIQKITGLDMEVLKNLGSPAKSV